ncbi:MAG: exo-alpha-sialidase [Planctomycetes bacterium]|nr:exo-alpha-sialidase [Planctomycetota bacterium]
MSDRLLVGTKKGLFSFRRSGRGAWTPSGPSFPGVPVSMVCHDPRDGGVLLALNHGHFGVKFHRSDDDGASWRELAAPAYPPRPEGEPELVDMIGRRIPSTLKDVWSMVPGGRDQPGRIWCGTIPGALFRSDDGGASWQLVESLWNDPSRTQWMGGGADAPGIHSICVDPRDGRRLSIAISCAGIWHSDDDGATWTAACAGMRAEYAPPGQEEEPLAQDPHQMVRCQAAPERLWVQHHNGIFRSDDGGRRWTEIKQAGPSCFGFAVAVHPRRPDCAWFVPAKKDEFRIPVDGKLVVTRTRDGGRSFDVLDRGLPQIPAYDLVYRHGLDIAADGERLAFGSTTGGLWVTENGGDEWHALPVRLPPVHCVRFA